MGPLALAAWTTDGLKAVLEGSAPCAALVPVGSVEPHGPHLPLGTDTIISARAAEAAAEKLRARGIAAFVAPSVGYGVTDFAGGFAGAVSVDAAALTAFLRAVARAYLAAGFRHVCLVNNHLEPAHDAAVGAAREGFAAGEVSVACPLARRWARTLSAEFKSGACHAGRYETSLVLAAEPDRVDSDAAARLPALATSLSDGIREGRTTFLAMGLSRAYSGAPAEATADEGRALYDLLAEMIATETLEGLAALATESP